MFYRVFVAEEFGKKGGKVLGDTSTDVVQTLLEAFLNMSLRSACFIDETFFFPGKQQNI